MFNEMKNGFILIKYQTTFGLYYLYSFINFMFSLYAFFVHIQRKHKHVRVTRTLYRLTRNFFLLINSFDEVKVVYVGRPYTSC